ncbi:MAG: ribosome-associated translation inhibitor RaiA [Cyclobacteriaceae bacterium]|nr:ribosome-associated translation inhibitor RaiA [Cyclobacteriaceae bacterium]
MNFRMHSVHFDADQKLLDYIAKKVEKLQTFNQRIVDGEVILRIEKSHLNKSEIFGNKILELKVNVPGQQLFTKESSNTFEAAIDLAVETMSRQLKKHKEKKQIRKADLNDL